MRSVLVMAASKISTVRRIGFYRYGKIFIERFLLRLLWMRFPFDTWHLSASSSARPYRQQVADLVNQLHPTCVVEIGCGLGEILKLLDASARYGYDLDEHAVQAARFIRGGSIYFESGSFADVSVNKMDVLILVNWIHNVPPDELSLGLKHILHKTRYIILDAIDPGTPGYRFNHDFDFLKGKAVELRVEAVPDEKRSLRLYEVLLAH